MILVGESGACGSETFSEGEFGCVDLSDLIPEDLMLDIREFQSVSDEIGDSC